MKNAKKSEAKRKNDEAEEKSLYDLAAEEDRKNGIHPGKYTGELESEEEGIEEVCGRKIPFRKFTHKSGSTTWYGDKGGSLLVRSQTPARVLWSAYTDAWLIERPRLATRQLRDENLDEPEVQHLFYAVRQIKLHPEIIHDSDPFSDGATVRDLVQHAIVTGNRHNLDRLSRFVEAVHCPQASKRESVARAISAAARREKRVPTASEALGEFAKQGGDADAKNFYAVLHETGFGWLIKKKRGA